MKQLLILVSFLSSFTNFACCNKDANDNTSEKDSSLIPNPKETKMKVTIGSRTFMATLYDNATANAFQSRLPMTIQMTELNGNEKYYDLPYGLPTSATNPGTIKTGDIMLYGSNTLVIFYKDFSTSYSYTRLGRIGSPAELVEALGMEGVTVSFESEK